MRQKFIKLTFATTWFGAVEVNHEPRRVGKSNYNSLSS
jgi:hypothetical protein